VLWIVALAGQSDIDLALLLEPSTTALFRLAEAIAEGSTMSLSAGGRKAWWIEAESLRATYLYYPMRQNHFKNLICWKRFTGLTSVNEWRLMQIRQPMPPKSIEVRIQTCSSIFF